MRRPLNLSLKIEILDDANGILYSAEGSSPALMAKSILAIPFIPIIDRPLYREIIYKGLYKLYRETTTKIPTTFPMRDKIVRLSVV